MWGRTKYAFPFLTEKKKVGGGGGLETSIYSLKSRLTEPLRLHFLSVLKRKRKVHSLAFGYEMQDRAD